MKAPVLLPVFVMAAMLWVSVAVAQDTGNPDQNVDGVVDMMDIVTVVGCFGRLDTAIGCADTDLVPLPDGDGITTILDLSYVRK